MKPIDFRNETWEQVQARVEGLRLEVWLALGNMGDCTTRQLAEKSGIDILTLRPRMTELYQMGLVELANPDSRGGEGVYRYVPAEVARQRFEQKQAEITEMQIPLL